MFGASTGRWPALSRRCNFSLRPRARLLFVMTGRLGLEWNSIRENNVYAVWSVHHV